MRFVQIVVKDRNKALKVAAEAKALPKGNVAALRALVAKDSEDEPRARAAAMWAHRPQRLQPPKAVEDAAFALAQVNDVSDPIQTESGYTIIVLTRSSRLFQVAGRGQVGYPVAPDLRRPTTATHALIGRDPKKDQDPD